jgi:DNA-binding NarL/FixJ family response regulator
MHEKVKEVLMHSHRIECFETLYEAYKWIKRNQIPDIIITDFEMDQPTQLQSIKFLQTKVKLKNTKMIGYSDVVNADYLRLALTHKASRLFLKSELISGLIDYLNLLSSPAAAKEEFVPENSTRSLGVLTKRASLNKK